MQIMGVMRLYSTRNYAHDLLGLWSMANKPSLRPRSNHSQAIQTCKIHQQVKLNYPKTVDMSTVLEFKPGYVHADEYGKIRQIHEGRGIPAHLRQPR